MQLSFSNIGCAAQDDEALVALLVKNEFTGLEIAPSRFVGERPYGKCEKAAAKAERLKSEYNLSIPSMQSIWYGVSGNLFKGQDSPKLVETTRKAVDFAAAIHCPSLVFGCPKGRVMAENQTENDAVGFFTAICAYAAQHKITISLEANPAVYGTNFCNTSAEAFAFAQKIPGLKVNYDLGTLLTNGESLNVLTANLHQVQHIHISEPQLAPIEKRSIHAELAKLLRQNDYKGFVSIEMKTSPISEATRVIPYIAEVFA